MHRKIPATPWNRLKTTTAPVSASCSLDRVKRNLGLDTVTDYDTTLQELILSASQAVQNDLGRCLTTTSYTLYLDKWPGREIQLPHPPLISVTSVKYYGDSTETLDTFSTGSYTISTAGYGANTDDVPDTIQTAVAMTACYWFDQPIPVITGTTATELPLGVSRLIDSERFTRY